MFSTLNRNPKSYLFAILGAEYVLRLLPRGTHDWTRFLRPAELAAFGRRAGLDLERTIGMTYNPLTKVYRLAPDTSVNYLAAFRKPADAAEPLPVAAVLFDLDGTLADSAGDLALALNHVRAGRGLPPVPAAGLRAHASSGARGLLAAGMDVLPDHPDYAALREQFLAHYEACLATTTVLFDGVTGLLDEIEARGLAWGIVTNKHTRFTVPVVRALGLDVRAGTVIAGDTTPHAKPHPAPLLRAAQDLRRRARRLRVRRRRPARRRGGQRGRHADDRRQLRLHGNRRGSGAVAGGRLDRRAARPAALAAARGYAGQLPALSSSHSRGAPSRDPVTRTG